MFSSHIHNERKEGFWHTLRHLPKFAVVLLALVALFVASTVTYAIVETIKEANVKVEKSGVNEFGREQLTVAFDSCAEQEKNGTTYELKKDSRLSAEDGAKALQAKCERDAIGSWIRQDPALSNATTNSQHGPMELRFSGLVGTFQNLTEDGISIHSTTAFTPEEQGKSLPFPKNTRVIEDGKVVDQKSLKPGDTVLYFSPNSGPGHTSTDPANVTVFKLSLDAKYYGLDMESYIRVRQPCNGNPTHACLESNHINMVTLIIAHGDNISALANDEDGRTVQGKVVSWNSNEIKLDVGNSVVYTVRTKSNIIDTYNNSTVYGLGSFDSIYSKTDPEELKVQPGDILEINYSEKKGQFSDIIESRQLATVMLMVERRVDDLSVLRKY